MGEGWKELGEWGGMTGNGVNMVVKYEILKKQILRKQKTITTKHIYDERTMETVRH